MFSTRYPENGAWAVPQLDLQVGDRVRFVDDLRWWWTVRAVTPHFAALTRQVPFQPAGTLCYTVVDWRNGVRGPCDLIGQGYGDGSYSEEQCAEMLAGFEVPPWQPDEPDRDPDEPMRLEVSQRNWTRVAIGEHTRGGVHQPIPQHPLMSSGDGETVTVKATVGPWLRRITRQGRAWASGALFADGFGVEFLLFPAMYDTDGGLLAEGEDRVVTGRVDLRDGCRPRLMVRSLAV